MSALPKSTLGLISLFIFVAWLVFLMAPTSITEPLGVVNDANADTMDRIENSATDIVTGDPGFLGINTLVSGTSLVGNLILAWLLFIVSMVVSMVIFFSVLLMIPVEISGILVALISIGFIMSLLRAVIPE